MTAPKPAPAFVRTAAQTAQYAIEDGDAVTCQHVGSPLRRETELLTAVWCPKVVVCGRDAAMLMPLVLSQCDACGRRTSNRPAELSNRSRSFGGLSVAYRLCAACGGADQ